MQIRGVANSIDTIHYNEPDPNIEDVAFRKASREKTNIDIDRHYKEERKYTEEELIKSIESANEQFIAYDRRFEFSIHEKTKQILVKIIDVKTDEVIREIPPEKILDMVAAIWEISGIIVDERI